MSSKLVGLVSDLRVELVDLIPALRSQSRLRVKEMSHREVTHSELMFEEAVIYRLLWSKTFEQAAQTFDVSTQTLACFVYELSKPPHGKQLLEC